MGSLVSATLTRTVLDRAGVTGDTVTAPPVSAPATPVFAPPGPEARVVESPQVGGGEGSRPVRASGGHHRWMKATMVGIDMTSVAIAGIVAFSSLEHTKHLVRFDYMAISAAAMAVFGLAFAQQQLYNSRHISRRADELRRLVNGAALGTTFLAALTLLFKMQVPRSWFMVIGGVSLLLSGLGREVLRRWIKNRRAAGQLARRVLLVGSNEEAQELLTMLSDTAELGYDVVGRISTGSEYVVATSGGPVNGTVATGVGISVGENSQASISDNDRAGHHSPPWLGTTDDILRIAQRLNVSGVVVATTDIDLDSANRLVRTLTNEGLYVEMSSAMRDIASRRVTIRPLGRYPVMTVEPVENHGWRAVLKRCFDVTLSVLILAVLSPILGIAAAAIRLTSGRGVLFHQQRVGRNGKEFTVLKFRTMVHNAEAMLPELWEHNEAAGPMFKMTKDPRVTKVGEFLRKTSLDEVPQFVNVIRGEMSLVGPRPALPSEVSQWNDDLLERLRVKPGITGNWQVNGRFTASFEDYQRLDMFYVDNWSIITDLVILGKTIPAVLKRNGAA